MHTCSLSHVIWWQEAEQRLPDAAFLCNLWGLGVAVRWAHHHRCKLHPTEARRGDPGHDQAVLRAVQKRTGQVWVVVQHLRRNHNRTSHDLLPCACCWWVYLTHNRNVLAGSCFIMSFHCRLARQQPGWQEGCQQRVTRWRCWAENWRLRKERLSFRASERAKRKCW